MSEYSPLSPAGGNAWEQRMGQHEGLVRWVVRRQYLGNLPYQDALHEGRLGLWAALRRYDPRRGTAFSTYAVPAIAHAVWRAVAAAGAVQHPAPAPVATGDLASAWPGGAPPEGLQVDPLDRAALRILLQELLAHLPPRLHQIVVAHYGLDGQPPQTFAALGAQLDISRQRVQQLHAHALGVLAHPAHSLPLRRFLGRHRRQDYWRTLALLRRQARRGRRRRAGP
jgi:RNA polymerase sigma factor (sigma-70 family)